ncbi:hypothetical protein GCM10023237_60820 [Streptomyces coeruleoprunus]
MEQVGRGVLRPDGHRLLEHDVARVEDLVHHVRGHADLGLAVDEGQMMGENPAYLGSSESWTFSVPWRGRV